MGMDMDRENLQSQRKKIPQGSGLASKIKITIVTLISICVYMELYKLLVLLPRETIDKCSTLRFAGEKFTSISGMNYGTFENEPFYGFAISKNRFLSASSTIWALRHFVCALILYTWSLVIFSKKITFINGVWIYIGTIIEVIFFSLIYENAHHFLAFDALTAKTINYSFCFALLVFGILRYTPINKSRVFDIIYMLVLSSPSILSSIETVKTLAGY